jgi:hypothetical protein
MFEQGSARGDYGGGRMGSTTSALAGAALIALLVVGLFVDVASMRAFDVAALALGAVTFLGMRPILGAAQRVWVAIAVAIPLAGIPALLVPGLEGRWALMLGGLLLAWRMTRCDRFRLLGWTGVVANGLLLLVVFGAAGDPDPAAADVAAAANLLLLVWLPWLVYRTLKPLPGRPVPVGMHHVDPGGGCRFGGSDTTELFDLPLGSRAEGSLGTFVGVADSTTRFTVNEADVTLMKFLDAYDEDVPFQVRVEESGRLAEMVIDTRAGAS